MIDNAASAWISVESAFERRARDQAAHAATKNAALVITLTGSASNPAPMRSQYRSIIEVFHSSTMPRSWPAHALLPRCLQAAAVPVVAAVPRPDNPGAVARP